MNTFRRKSMFFILRSKNKQKQVDGFKMVLLNNTIHPTKKKNVYMHICMQVKKSYCILNKVGGINKCAPVFFVSHKSLHSLFIYIYFIYTKHFDFFCHFKGHGVHCEWACSLAIQRYYV